MQACATGGEALLADVREDLVDFVDNFDGSESEPTVLPAKLPMLLLNGATGIAVGMATNCPPHNLGEVVDALRALIDNRELSDDELLELVPAPDFPTGGVVMGTYGAKDMHSTGRGTITIRAAAHVEPPSRAGGREAVVVTELPYGVAKNRLLEQIATMVNEKKLEGIAEIRDESSMEGLRIVFEVKRDAEPLVVLNNMYKRSALQNSFAGNLMAVVGQGRMPEQLTCDPPSTRSSTSGRLRGAPLQASARKGGGEAPSRRRSAHRAGPYGRDCCDDPRVQQCLRRTDGIRVVPVWPLDRAGGCHPQHAVTSAHGVGARYARAGGRHSARDGGRAQWPAQRASEAARSVV